jgi:dynein heavy chain
MMI